MTSATVQVCSKYCGNTERVVIVFFWETSLKEKCELSLKGWKIFLNIKSRERKIIGEWAADLKEGKQKKVFFRELHKDLHSVGVVWFAFGGDARL